MDRLSSIIGSSLRDILSHKLRIFLTSLGVIVGVIAVVGISAGAYSLQKNITRQFESLGSDTFYLVKFSFTHFTSGNISRSDFMDLFNRPSFELSYQREFERHVTAAERIAPSLNYRRQVTYDRRTSDRAVSILATNEQMLGMGGIDIAHGRFFIPPDIEHRRPVCVIGQELVTELFRGRDPIGQRINVGGIPFQVIGILDSISNLDHTTDNRMIIIPITTGIKYFQYGWNLQYAFQAKPGQLEDAMNQTTNVMRRIRGLRHSDDNNFDFVSADMILDLVRQFTSVAFFVMIAISAISLFVAGIGIMNVMYVTVSERTKEIGIRKSIGAFRRDILLQFTIEAIMVSTIGGLLGIGILQIMVMVVRRVITNPAITIYFPPQIAILGIVFSVVVGVVFGIAPAVRASKLNVVDALRK